MTFKEINFYQRNYFVAMEYHSLILNRTYLVLFHEEHLIGIKVNGYVGAELDKDPLSNYISRIWAIKGDLKSSKSYINKKYTKKIEHLDLLGDEILKIERANFRIPYSDITEVIHNEKKKWGMGYYPHDGRVRIKTKSGKKKEFIILGAQSGFNIKNRLLDECEL